jgi:hypothetical protein
MGLDGLIPTRPADDRTHAPYARTDAHAQGTLLRRSPTLRDAACGSDVAGLGRCGGGGGRGGGDHRRRRTGSGARGGSPDDAGEHKHEHGGPEQAQGDRDGPGATFGAGLGNIGSDARLVVKPAPTPIRRNPAVASIHVPVRRPPQMSHAFKVDTNGTDRPPIESKLSGQRERVQLGCKRVEQLAKRVFELLHALALHGIGELVVVDAGSGKLVEDGLGGGESLGERRPG